MKTCLQWLSLCSRFLLLSLLFSNFAFAQQHTVSSFTPANASAGETVTIVGTNLTSVSGVSFGGVAAASFSVISSTKVTAVVASGSVSGSVSVSKAGYTTTNSSGFTYSQIPTVTSIITDFGGFWNTNTTSNNPTYPNDSHNLLAFTYGGVTYSTGVNDSRLSSNGVSYAGGNFKALPAIMNGITSGTSLYIAVASKVDGNTGTAIYTHPNVRNLTIQNALSDGINGLNLGTGYTNLPVTATSNFTIKSIAADKISDNEPDLIITQIADPTGTATDVFKFLDGSGAVVGNQVQQDLSKISPLGTYYLDLFSVQAGVSFSVAKPVGVGSGGTNTTRQIRFMAFKLSDFGINTSNYSQIRSFQIVPSGVTDEAFVGYNATSLNVPPSIAINTNTSNSVICSSGGGSAYLEVSAAAAIGGSLSYVWEVSTDGGTNWSTVSNGGVYSGATTNALNISSATAGYKYRAVVTESSTDYSSTSPVFTITATTSAALSGTLNPTGFSNCLNASSGTTLLSVSPAGGTGTYSYQWMYSTASGGAYTDIPGATYSSYAPALNPSGTLYYKVKVTSGCLSNTSTAAAVVISGDEIQSVTNGTTCSTGTVTLSATATGGTISWYSVASAGTALATGTNYTTPSISGTTTYYVGTTSSGCGSIRVPVVATVVNTIALTSSNFNIINATNVCAGESSSVTVSTSALIDGTYTIIYDISGSNSVSAATASITMTGGYGSFTTEVLNTAGSNTLTITGVKSGLCTITPSSGNTVSIQSSNGAPSVSNFSVSVTDGCSNVTSVATLSSTSLGSGTYIVTYSVTGTNTVASTTAQVAFTAGNPGAGTFALPLLGTEGADNVLHITSIALLSSPTCVSVLSANSANFATNIVPTLEVGLPLTVCASSTQVNITNGTSAANYAALTWSTSNGTGSFSNNTTATALTGTTYSPSIADVAAGTRLLTLTASGNSGCNSVSKTVTLNITPLSVGGTVTGGTTVCASSNSTTLTLSGQTGTVSKWQYSAVSDFSSAVTDVANTTASLTATNLSTTRYYRAVVTNGVCTAANSNSANIVVNAASVGGSITGGGAVCAGTNNATLTLSGQTGTVTKWQYSNAIDFSSGVNDIANTTTQLLITNLSATTYYRAVVTSGICAAVNSNVETITVNGLPVASILSNNSPVCSGATAGFTLSGTEGAVITYNINNGSNATVSIASGVANISVNNVLANQTLNLISVSNISTGCNQSLSSSSTVTLSSYTITVTQAAHGSISPSSTDVVCGGEQVFTISPNSGFAISDVLVDGNSVGAVSLYTFSNVSSSHIITAVFTSSCTGYTWTGLAGDNDYYNTANWLCGVVPPTNTAENVTVDPQETMPLLSDVMLGDVIFNNGSAIDLNGHSLTITGNVTGTGWYKGSANADLTIGATANVGTLNFVSGGRMLRNFTVNGNAALGTALDIVGGTDPGTLVVNDAILTTNDNLTIKSDFNGTARIAKCTGTINGKVSVERYVRQNVSRGWRFMAVATKGTQSINSAWQEGATNYNANPVPGYGTRITASTASAVINGFDAQTYGNSLLQFVPGVSPKWVGFTGSLKTTPVATTSGWALYVRGDRNIDTSQNISNPSATVLRTKGPVYQGTQTPINVVANGFSLVGNVFASEIDFESVVKTGGIDNTYYVWDPQLTGSYGLGAFQAIVGPDWTVIPGGGSYGSAATSKIQSGMAFLVHATGTAGTVQLTEDAKSAGKNSHALGFRPQVVTSSLRTNLYAVAAGIPILADGDIISFSDTHSNNIDGSDAIKPTNFGEGIGMLRNGIILAVERRKTITDKDTVFFNVSGVKTMDYQLEFIPTALNTPGLVAVLEDNYLHTTTPLDLTTTNTITFSANASQSATFSNRFRVVFRVSTPLPVTFSSVSASKQNEKALVKWVVENETNIEKYIVEKSTDGIKFEQLTTVNASSSLIVSKSYSAIDANPFKPVSFYRIASIDKSGEKAYSNTVKVSFGEQAASIKVCPSVITNGHVALHVANIEAGTYVVKLVSNVGQLITTKQLQFDGGSGIIDIALSQYLAKGTYHLECIKPNNTVVNFTVVSK